MRKTLTAAIAAAALLAVSGPVQADMAAAERWINDEFQPSALSKDEQMAEMEWFINAAEPFQGMEINVLSETIPTHEYEANTLTKAFEEITGIKVNHQLLGEGEVVQAVQTQMQTGRNLYDAYINDSDLIGTHSRLQLAVNLTDWMAGEGSDVTNPGLDLDDFIGASFTTGPDGKLYQLPDQQFANLYWFRKDWFDREDLQAKFKDMYGYDLGVPVNWSAYEDIAEFFSVHVKEIDGVTVYGHMDYGKRAPDLGWRMTDAWLSMAGAGSKGCPMACRSMSGASAWKQARAILPALRSPVVAAPTARPRSMPSANGTNGCANMHRPQQPTTTSTSRCPRSARATSPSRSSGTRPSPHRW
jgi:glycerol transport system substrate-binding protein